MVSDQRAGRSSLPDQRTLLSWLFIGRLILAVGILMGAGLVWTERPQESFLVSIAVVIALTFTAYGVYIVHFRRRRPGKTFLLVQALVDLGVVTTVVHFAGQPQSAFPALYVLVVAAYALLMPPATGALTAVLASALFLGDTLWTRADAPDAAFWAQMLVFNLVFAIVAVLGHRLREAGMEQETLATELQRVRLEADDILRNIRSGVLTGWAGWRSSTPPPSGCWIWRARRSSPCRCWTSSRSAPPSCGPRSWPASATAGRSAGARAWCPTREAGLSRSGSVRPHSVRRRRRRRR